MLQVTLHNYNDDIMEEIVEIKDSTISSAIALLPLIPPKILKIRRDKRNLNVHQLVQACPHHNYRKLLNWQDYDHPSLQITSDSSLRAVPR